MRERAKKVKMLILDIDGVMTDGRIIYDTRGNELKCFNVLDGMGFVLLGQAKIKVALITAKGSKAVLRRAIGLKRSAIGFIVAGFKDKRDIHSPGDLL
ncbi:unnamed protein product [marine sediment metagenome]|uniref:3-deoxy-D-manno-octulosonate 8-phosphate phosphatase n=1 Tax=marine sediment metagenome TaxID=412755 RepID=X1N3E1_9ZZZZ